MRENRWQIISRRSLRGRLFVFLLPILLARLIVSQGWPWRRKPALSRFFMDRFSVPEVTDLDLVYRQFGFQPARLADQLAFLRRGAHWRRVFVS